MDFFPRWPFARYDSGLDAFWILDCPMSLETLPEERYERLLEIRRQIANGEYETRARLAMAIDAFLRRQDEDEPSSDELWRPRNPR